MSSKVLFSHMTGKYTHTHEPCSPAQVHCNSVWIESFSLPGINSSHSHKRPTFKFSAGARADTMFLRKVQSSCPWVHSVVAREHLSVAPYKSRSPLAKAIGLHMETGRPRGWRRLALFTAQCKSICIWLSLPAPFTTAIVPRGRGPYLAQAQKSAMACVQSARLAPASPR